MLLLLVFTDPFTGSAAIAQNGSQPSVKGVTEYTDPEQFLHTRVSKLLAIIERAQQARFDPDKCALPALEWGNGNLASSHFIRE